MKITVFFIFLILSVSLKYTPDILIQTFGSNTNLAINLF